VLGRRKTSAGRLSLLVKTISLFFCACGLLASAMWAANADKITPAEIPNSSIRILRFVQPVFPLRLSRQGVTNGEAKIAFELDPSGRLVDILPVSYTHALFAEATVDAMRSWLFEAAKSEGKPAGVVGELTMRFETNGVLVVARLTNLSDYAGGKLVYQPCEPARLDATPRLVQRVEPYYPKQFYVEGATGTVLLDFYIDERGRVRMPMVKGATESFLAATTVEAVRQWRFDSPMSQGKPVLVHVNQEFTFHPHSDGE
jgi:TonB family protein